VFYFYKTLAQLKLLAPAGGINATQGVAREDGDFLNRFEIAMDDNFNTAKAIAEISSEFTSMNKLMADKKLGKPEKAQAIAAFLHNFDAIASVVNILNEEPATVIEKMKSKFLHRIGIDRAELTDKIDTRTECKKLKDFARADAIRGALLHQGIKLLDYSDRTDWEILVE
jgi:cysteinyl-tRNA synthetase